MRADLFSVFATASFLTLVSFSSGDSSEADWTSLDQRPNPAWFDEAKLGIFIHWSVFSVPAVAWVEPDKPYGYGGHSCWYGMYIDHLRPLTHLDQQARIEAFHRATYGDVPFKALAPLFKAEAFDASQWAALFNRAGARYAFLTSNFHDGFCLWPSPQNPGWNSMDTGPKRDLLGEFSSAMREAGRCVSGRSLRFPRETGGHEHRCPDDPRNGIGHYRSRSSGLRPMRLQGPSRILELSHPSGEPGAWVGRRSVASLAGGHARPRRGAVHALLRSL